jgi:AhpD family alkylhydroperoxidase
LGELIALTVANANSCEYCNAAHSFIGEKLVHIDTRAIADAREGRSADTKTQAALEFSRILVQKRGLVNDTDVNALKAAGYTDAGIAEIIAHVAINLLTNYFNNAARVKVDFPEVELVETAVV